MSTRPILVDTSTEVNEALWEGGQGGEGLILVRVGRYPQAWPGLAQIIKKTSSPFLDSRFLAGLGSITLNCQGRGPWQGIGSGESSQGRGSGKADACETLAFRKALLAIWHAKRLRFARFSGDFARETLAFRKVFWRFWRCIVHDFLLKSRKSGKS